MRRIDTINYVALREIGTEGRHLTLLQRFSIYSFAVMTVLAVLLGLFVAQEFSVHMLNVYKNDMAGFIQSEGEVNLSPALLSRPATTEDRYLAIKETSYIFQKASQFSKTVLFNREGVVIWSTDRSQIGRRATGEKGLSSAIGGMRSLTVKSGTEGREINWLIPGSVLEMFIPIRQNGFGPVIGVIEVYHPLEDVIRLIRSALIRLWVTLFLCFALLYIILYKIVAQASRLIQRQHKDLEEMRRARYTETITALVSAIDAKDKYTSGHSTRVADVAVWIGRAMGLPDEQLELLHYAALLHDVGKIGVPDSVLGKPGRLTPEEMDQIRRHPSIGAQIFQPLKLIPREVLQTIEAHHERPDGCGYPAGIRGDNLPLFAKIVSAADCYDAMRSDRPYRKACSREETLAEIQRQAGSQFDPEVVKALLSVADKVEEEVYSKPSAASDNAVSSPAQD